MSWGDCSKTARTDARVLAESLLQRGLGSPSAAGLIAGGTGSQQELSVMRGKVREHNHAR
eukprot:9468599-Pyramimonas_sp.AAC.1